jgi:hypothetical protein
LENNNVTSAIPWTLLQAGGGVPPLLIAIAMLIWAVGCAGLSLRYGFRERWAATFDDYFLYCYCKKSGIDVLEILKKEKKEA